MECRVGTCRRPATYYSRIFLDVHLLNMFLGDFKLRNISVTDEFRRYSYGMVSFFRIKLYIYRSKPISKSQYYHIIAYEELDKDQDYFNLLDSNEEDEDLSTSEDADEEDDNIQLDSCSADDATDADNDINSLEDVYKKANPNIPESPGLVGTWSGFCYYGSSTASDIDGVTSFQIDCLDGQGKFTGGGRDFDGDFHIYGTIEGKTITFSKNYSQPVDGKSYEYSGEINEGLDRIDQGKWGPVESVPSWIFALQKKSVEYVQFHPSGTKDGKTKLRLLWNFAIQVTLHRLSARTIRWSVLEKRRDQRRRFIALFKGSRAVGLNASHAAELRTLQSTLSIADLTLYRRLALLEQDREVVHR